MPYSKQAEYRHIRVRNPNIFEKFKVITKMSHLDKEDQQIVRKRVPKNKRPHAKYTVGRLKGGKRIKGRRWKLQKIMVKKGGKKKK